MRHSQTVGWSGKFISFALAFALAGCVGAGVFAERAGAAVPHVVQPGETLSGIASANGLSAASVAAFNGMADANLVVSGSTIQVPSVDEAAATGVTTTDTTAAVATGAVPGSGYIPSAWGDLQLDPAAADSWNAMRAASLAQFGIDLAPAGPLSAMRTYEQQASLYDLYLSGAGAPANPPGTSSHEWGVAVDLADPSMRNVIDQIGPTYGWYGTIPSEWWHVAYGG